MNLLLARGVISGADVRLVLTRLTDLLGAKLEIERSCSTEEPDSLPKRSCAAGDALSLSIAGGLCLRGVPRSGAFSDAILEAARLLTPAVAWCLGTPMAASALRAPADETLETALARLDATITFSPEGKVVSLSSEARQILELGAPRRKWQQMESALVAAVQAFVRHERNQLQLAPGVAISFAAFSSEDRAFAAPLLGALHQLGTGSNWASAPVAPLLTGAELAVVGHLLAGESELSAGASLSMSAETVKTHRRHICRKLGVSSRVELSRLFGVRG